MIAQLALVTVSALGTCALVVFFLWPLFGMRGLRAEARIEWALKTFVRTLINAPRRPYKEHWHDTLHTVLDLTWPARLVIDRFIGKENLDAALDQVHRDLGFAVRPVPGVLSMPPDQTPRLVWLYCETQSPTVPWDQDHIVAAGKSAVLAETLSRYKHVLDASDTDTFGGSPIFLVDRPDLPDRGLMRCPTCLSKLRRLERPLEIGSMMTGDAGMDQPHG